MAMDIEGLKALLTSKMKDGKSQMSPIEQQAHLSKLNELKDLMSSMAMQGGDDEEAPADLSKVTVAADNKEDLLKGLDKAQELAGHAMPEGSDEEEKSESPEMEASEHDDSSDADSMSDDEIEQELQKLMALKQKRMK